MSNIMSTDNIDTSPLIGETAQYNSLRVSLNGLVLRSQDIADIQINYGDLIKGKLSFTDTMNIAEFTPLTFTMLEIAFSDATKNETTLNFLVVDAQVLRIKNNQINIILKFEELTCNALTNTYMSKSFKDKTMIEIIEELFTLEGLPANFYAGDNDYVYDYFVVPGNLSLLEFIQVQIKYSAIKMFSDRNGLTFVSMELVNYTDLLNPAEYDFSLNRDEQFPYWNIMEYDAHVTRLKNTQKAVKANLSNTTVKDLRYIPEAINIEKYYPDQKINGAMGFGSLTLPEIVTNLGTKEISHIFHNDIEGDTEDYRSIIQEQQKIKIAVEGLGTLRMYSKIKINLPRSLNVQTQENDETFSGIFVITGVIDKFIGGNFVQFLTIQAPDYGPGSDQIE